MLLDWLPINKENIEYCYDYCYQISKSTKSFTIIPMVGGYFRSPLVLDY